jgi:four helix bundle suffix protein
VSTNFISPHGNHHALFCYQKAEMIYDLTHDFCQRFIPAKDRTADQMLQAARSGKQNIVEGSQVSGTSKSSEIRLKGVARASLQELLSDYEDYLRSRSLRIWDKESKEAAYVRRLGRDYRAAPAKLRHISKTRPAEIVANVAICLIHQANFLLDRLLMRLEKDFLENGGVRENMLRSRRAHRTKDRPHKPPGPP